MTITRQTGNGLLYSLSLASSVCMKVTMDTSLIGGTLLRAKFDFVFVRLFSLNVNVDNTLKTDLWIG